VPNELLLSFPCSNGLCQLSYFSVLRSNVPIKLYHSTPFKRIVLFESLRSTPCSNGLCQLSYLTVLRSNVPIKLYHSTPFKRIVPIESLRSTPCSNGLCQLSYCTVTRAQMGCAKWVTSHFSVPKWTVPIKLIHSTRAQMGCANWVTSQYSAQMCQSSYITVLRSKGLCQLSHFAVLRAQMDCANWVISQYSAQMCQSSYITALRAQMDCANWVTLCSTPCSNGLCQLSYFSVLRSNVPIKLYHSTPFKRIVPSESHFAVIRAQMDCANWVTLCSTPCSNGLCNWVTSQYSAQMCQSRYITALRSKGLCQLSHTLQYSKLKWTVPIESHFALLRA
jgi:hypothetical protein